VLEDSLSRLTFDVSRSSQLVARSFPLSHLAHYMNTSFLESAFKQLVSFQENLGDYSYKDVSNRVWRVKKGDVVYFNGFFFWNRKR